MSELLGWESAMKATRLDGVRPQNVTMSVVLQCRSTFSSKQAVGVVNIPAEIMRSLPW